MRRILSILAVFGIGYLFGLIPEEVFDGISDRFLGDEPTGLELAVLIQLSGLASVASAALVSGAIARPGDTAAQWLLYAIQALLLVVVVGGVWLGVDFVRWLEENYPELSRWSALVYMVLAIIAIEVFYGLGQRLSKAMTGEPGDMPI